MILLPLLPVMRRTMVCCPSEEAFLRPPSTKNLSTPRGTRATAVELRAAREVRLARDEVESEAEGRRTFFAMGVASRERVDREAILCG
jgi:hypothetical protein